MFKPRRGHAKGYIEQVLEKIEPDLLPDEMSQLTDEVDSSLAAYGLQANKDPKDGRNLDELRLRRQETLKKSIAIALSNMRSSIERQSPESRAESRLRAEIKRVLKRARIKLTLEERSKIEDRMIRLLDDYTRAPDEDKQRVYEHGEQEVFSILDPPAKSLGASGW